MNYSLFLFLFFCGRLVAQVPTIQWEKTYGGSNDDYFYSIIASSSNFAILGYTESSGGYINNHHNPPVGFTSSDVWVVVIDSLGNMKWNKCYGSTSHEEGYSFYQTYDSCFIIAASANDNGGDVSGIHTSLAPSFDYWIIKIDSIGSIIWSHCYGGSHEEDAFSIIQSKDSGFLIVGRGRSGDYDVPPVTGTADTWVVKIDSNSSIRWSKTFGGLVYTGPVGYNSCFQSNNGNYYVASATLSDGGQVTGYRGGTDIWVTNIDTGGNLNWERCYGGTGLDNGNAIIPAENNGFYLTGYTDSNDSDVTASIGGGDVWLLKADSLGNILWEKCYGGNTSAEYANAICKTRDNGLVMAGLCTSNSGQVTGSHGMQDMWVVKVDSLGNFEWGKALGGSQNDQAEAILQTLDGGFIVAGGAVSNDGDVSSNLGSKDGWVVRLSPAGLSIKDPMYDVMDLSVLQNENSITARFFSRKNETMDLIIYNLEGQIIAQKTVEVSIGVNYFEVPMEFTTGNYILNVTNSYFTTTKKFFLK